MNKYTFIKERDLTNKFDTTEVKFICETSDRSDVIEAFCDFLVASGFRIEDIKDKLDIE